jgi:hypothetical protein
MRGVGFKHTTAVFEQTKTVRALDRVSSVICFRCRYRDKTSHQTSSANIADGTVQTDEHKIQVVPTYFHFS